MQIVDNFHAALVNILQAKLRSFLAVLGILIGTTSVVALVMSGQLATQHALEQFKTLGTNLLAVSIYQENQTQNQATGEKFANLNLASAMQSISADPHIQMAAPYTIDYLSAYYNDNNLNATLIGATENLAAVIKINLEQGRFISLLDKNQNYAVIGQGIATNLRKLGLSELIGAQISVGQNIFTIVGVTKTWPQNNFFDQDINNTIIIPIQTSLALSKYSQIQNIVYRIDHHVDLELLKKNLLTYINHYVSQTQIFVRSPEQIIQSMQKQQATFTILLGVIGSISLLVGGIGVMNIMLVSVVERRREIGIRRAVGAKQNDIRDLFLAEAVSLSLFGGIIGVLLGIFLSWLFAKIFHWEFFFFATPAVVGFIVSVLIGIFFGFYPAYRAAKLDPILLLRSE